MADVILECEECKGRRFKKEILEIKFNGVNIDDILNMTIDDAIIFLKKIMKIELFGNLNL